MRHSGDPKNHRVAAIHGTKYSEFLFLAERLGNIAYQGGQASTKSSVIKAAPILAMCQRQIKTGDRIIDQFHTRQVHNAALRNLVIQFLSLGACGFDKGRMQ